MKVRIIKDQPAYKSGEVYQVTECDDTYFAHGRQLIYKSDCILLPEEPGNRIVFDWETWKEKGGKVWFGAYEVSQLTKFDIESKYEYAGVYRNNLGAFSADQLTMSAPDRVEYFNVYEGRTSGSYDTELGCRDGRFSFALHILEVNHTQGTNRIVHRYNEGK